MTDIEDRLDKQIINLERFLRELEEARKFGEESNTLKVSPIAGLLEKAELETLLKIRGDKI